MPPPPTGLWFRKLTRSLIGCKEIGVVGAGCGRVHAEDGEGSESTEFPLPAQEMALAPVLLPLPLALPPLPHPDKRER